MRPATITANELQRKAIEAAKADYEAAAMKAEIAHQRFLDFFAGVLFAAGIEGGEFRSIEGNEITYMPLFVPKD